MDLQLPADLEAVVGRTLELGDEDYAIKNYRGSGKRGHVFCAETSRGRIRALKFIPLEKLDGRWEQEMYKAYRLDRQPSTVHFYSFLYYANYGVMIFDYVEGRSLREMVDKQELTVSDIQRILESLLFFRKDCIRENVRHGDLHAGNIILREPVMGVPRPYEVMITDFGIGETGALLEPRDDFAQIGAIATYMLQAIRREELGHSDRVVFAGLCQGAALKGLREHSSIERGHEEQAIDAVLQELSRLQVSEGTLRPARAEPTNFGDYLAGEQIGNRWEEWKELFVSGFPGYDDIVSRNTSVLTGTRGCGKTIVFRRLSMLLALEVGPVDNKAAGSLVGIYFNMNDVADAFLFGQRKQMTDSFARRVIQFFHLSIFAEIVRVAAVAREKASEQDRIGYDRANRWLFEYVCEIMRSERLDPGPGLELRTAGTILDRAKEDIRHSIRPHKGIRALGENDWLKRLVPQLQEKMPWVNGRPMYFFLDDYSLPRVNAVLQKVLNSVVFQRSDSFYFKVATESPSTLCREDYSNKLLDCPHDFELTDLGSVTIDLADDVRESFLDEVFSRRLARDVRFRGKGLAQILGNFDMSWAELARRIRGNTAGKSGKVAYYGKEVFVNMWSGDTRSMVKIAQNLLESLSDSEQLQLPIEQKLQNKTYRDTGGEFLHLLRACGMPKTLKRDVLEAMKINSWGEHLVRIAEAFKTVALHELQTRQGGREGRDEPKQAFRIEIVDDFVLNGLELEIYRDLVRYGVFLQDDRGKSIRGAIIPRLYLRRLLIPYCTLTFSKVDNISMNAAAFRLLLLKPQEFVERWKKERPVYTNKQQEFDFKY